MKKFLSFLLLMMLAACGTDGKDGVVGPQGPGGSDCWSSAGDTNGDGKNNIHDCIGPQGDDGAVGPQGDDGEDGNTTAQKTIDLYKKYRSSVYRVELKCNGTLVGVASAFKTGAYEASTNKHVVNFSCGGYRTIVLQTVYSTIDTTTSDDYPALSSTSSAGYDLAKITTSVSLPGETIAIPDSVNPVTGSYTLSLSFPLGFEDLYTLLGQVSSNYTWCGSASGYSCSSYDFATTNDTDHGSSGSPIFDLESGELIGITTAGTDGENMNVNWVIDASKLNSF